MNTFNGTDPAAQAELARLAAIVDAHVADWPAVGAALREIRDRNLYRAESPTWVEFLRKRWDMSESYASRLINAAELHRKTLPLGKPPQTERVARPIAALPEAQQVDAWQEAVTLAASDPVRPEHVSHVIAKRKTKTTKSRPKPTRLRVPGAVIIIEPGRGWTDAPAALRAALAQLEQQTRRAA